MWAASGTGVGSDVGGAGSGVGVGGTDVGSGIEVAGTAVGVGGTGVGVDAHPPRTSTSNILRMNSVCLRIVFTSSFELFD